MASEMLAGPTARLEPGFRDFPGHPTAVVRASARREELPAVIGAAFNRFYGTKELGIAAPGHNVVFYPVWKAGAANPIECGILTTTPVVPKGDVTASALPAARVAMLTHLGSYAEMSRTYDALHAWCAAHGHRLAGAGWEEYGDIVDDDPAHLRTDVYVTLLP